VAGLRVSRRPADEVEARGAPVDPKYMFFVYTMRTYSAAVTGKAWKSVHCEKCSADYAYEMVRRGSARSSSAYGIGNAWAKRAAEQGARQKLQKRLKDDSDPVACPHCGWIQSPMVAALRRRAHRWLKWTAYIILSLGLVAAAMGILTASNGFSHPIEPDQLKVIAILIGGSILICAAGLWIRSLLAQQIDPNCNHPNQPGIIPGAPQAFKLDPARSHPEATAPAPQPVLAATTSAPTLAYESQPLQLEPGGWVTVQLMKLRHPPCCCCLGQTHALRTYTCGPLAKVQLPVCEKCVAFYKGEQTWINLVAAVAGAALGVVAAFVWSASSLGFFALLAIGCTIGLLVGLCVSAKRAAPAGFSRFSAELNTVRIRFRNQAYVRALLAAGQIV
jgi:hypothetical protein